jgi:hypothetical protein
MRPGKGCCGGVRNKSDVSIEVMYGNLRVLSGSKASKDGDGDDGETHGDWLDDLERLLVE